METIEKKTNTLILRVLLFLIFTVSAGLKLIVGFENFEIALLENGAIGNWMGAVYVTNIVAILEIACGVMALFGRFKPIQMVNCFFLLVLYIGSLFLSVNSVFFQDYTLLYFGNFYVNISIWAVLIILCIRLKLLSNESKIVLKWPYQLLIIFSLSAVYIGFGSINPYQFDVKTETYHKGVANWTSFNNALAIEYPDLMNENLLVAFFSTECSHCQLFAKKLSFSKAMHPNRKMLFVFWSDEDEVNKFMKNSGASTPTLRLSQNAIMNIVGVSFPVFYEFNKGKPMMEYSGRELSYRVIDKLFEK